jgi:hypothetical protein
MSFHDLESAGSVHIPYNWVYANASARTSASGFTSDDVGKLAKQTDNDSLWMLTATTPTWVMIGGDADHTRVHEFWDFVGNNIDTDVWSTAVSGAGSTISIATDKQYGEIIMEGNVNGGYSAFTLKNWSYRSINVSDNFDVSLRVKAIDNYSSVTIGLIKDANDQILMYKSGSDNWKVHTYSGGTGTTTDTGVAQDGNYHIFRITGTSSEVKFYIDGVLEATHTTNITTEDLTIEVKLDMITTDQTYFYCDWIDLKCDR